MANRLHAIFPQAKILVVIRNQIDSLLSMYGFLVRQLGENVNVSYGRPSIDSMEKWISDQEKFIGRSYITSLQYSKLIDGYSKLFGKENITVLLFEELVQEPASFFSKVYDFFDVKDDFNKNRALPKKRNTKPSNRELFYYKLRTKLPNAELSKYVPNIIIKVWRKYLYAGSTKRTIDELPLEMKNRLISMYSLDNKKLQEQLNLDLKKYGYKI